MRDPGLSASLKDPSLSHSLKVTGLSKAFKDRMCGNFIANRAVTLIYATRLFASFTVPHLTSQCWVNARKYGPPMRIESTPNKHTR